MTTLKSLEARLKKIPEPDLERPLNEMRYLLFKQLSWEQLHALRASLRDPANADRDLTFEDLAAGAGISTAEIKAMWHKAVDAVLTGGVSIESGTPAARPAIATGTNLPATESKKTPTAQPPNERIATAPKAASAPPPAPDENERFFEQFSLEQRLAVRQLTHELAKAGRTIMSRAEICAALGISRMEFEMRLAKAQLPEIAPDPKIQAAIPATESEVSAPPSQSKEKNKKEKKTNNISRPDGSISAAPLAPGSAAAPSKKSLPAKSPSPPGKQP